MIGRLYLGRYEAQKLLGEGGMGKVYLGRQLDLGRPVVIKVMHDHIASDPKFRDRFQRETLLMARFQHPNTVTLYDASLTDPFGPCIVMEYIKGVNLEKLLKDNGRLSPARVCRILGQLCDALQAAHATGMIHRDLKPANIMITENDTPRERVKVMDFGLAKLVEEGHIQQVTDTSVDFAVGTPGYICPEQVRGETMDHRGDLYSVGIMLFELLAGRLPFLGNTSMDVLLAHATEDPPTFAELGLNGVIPAAVEEVVRWCLAKDPADRPQCARDLSRQFEEALAPRTSAAGMLNHQEASDDTPMPELLASGTDSDPILLSPGQVAPKASIRALTQPDAAALLTERTAAAREVNGITYQIDAWMPESIAIMKLKGFAHDTDGTFLESSPGRVLLRLSRPSGQAGAGFSWFGGVAARRNGPLDIDLRFSKVPGDREGKLSIFIVFRASHPSLLGDEVWQHRCQRAFVKLRGYLMGGLSNPG